MAALKDTLSSLQANADGSRSAMLKLNLREAQETLSRWLLRLLYCCCHALPAAAVHAEAQLREAQETLSGWVL